MFKNKERNIKYNSNSMFICFTKCLLVSIEVKQSNGDQSQKSKRKTRDEKNDNESPSKAKKQSKFTSSNVINLLKI